MNANELEIIRFESLKGELEHDINSIDPLYRPYNRRSLENSKFYTTEMPMSIELALRLFGEFGDIKSGDGDSQTVLHFNAHSLFSAILSPYKIFLQSPLDNANKAVQNFNNSSDKKAILLADSEAEAQKYDFVMAFHSESFSDRTAKDLDRSNILKALNLAKKRAIVIVSARVGESSQFSDFRSSIIPHLEAAITISDFGDIGGKYYALILSPQKLDNSHFISLEAQNMMFSDRGRRPFIIKIDEIIKALNKAYQCMQNGDFGFPKKEAKIIDKDELKELDFNLNTSGYELFMQCKMERINSGLSYQPLGLLGEIRVSQSMLHRHGSKRGDENSAQTLLLSATNFAECGFSKDFITADIADLNRVNIYSLHPFDLIISTRGRVGPVAIVDESVSANSVVTTPTCTVFRIGGLDKKRTAIAYYMFLKSAHGQRLLRSSLIGSLMEQISPITLRSILAPVFTQSHLDILNERFFKELELYGELQKAKERIELLNSEFFKELK